jgi:hypothetical protein
MTEKSFEVGDQLVLTAPVVRVVENDPWSTVTFSLANGQWVTIRQDAKDITRTLKGPVNADHGHATAPEPVHGSTVLSNGEGSIAVAFNVQSGSAEFAFSAEEFMLFAARIISEAARVAASVDGPPSEPAVALPVRAVSIDQHPSEASAAVLAVQVGNAKLAFDIEASLLLQSVKQFLDRRKSARSTPNHQASEAGAVVPMDGRQSASHE